MSRIYRIASVPEWEQTLRTGRYPESALDRRDGFLHCSTEAQLASTLDAHFRGQGDLMLLHIATDRLGRAELRWEASRGGEAFPHLYGPLLATAIVAHEPILVDAEGRHRVPSLTGKGLAR